MLSSEEHSDLERQIVAAALAGDRRRVDRLRATLAFGQLTDELKRDYRAAKRELQRAQMAMNAAIERIPDLARGEVIKMIEIEIKRLESMGL